MDRRHWRDAADHATSDRPNPKCAANLCTQRTIWRTFRGVSRDGGRSGEVGDDEELGGFGGRAGRCRRRRARRWRSNRPRSRVRRGAVAAHEGCNSRSRDRLVGMSPDSERISVTSCDTPGPSIELGIVVVLHGEVGVERAQREPASRPQRPGQTGDDRSVVAVGGHHPERPLTQADHRIELGTRTASPERRPARTSPRRRPAERPRSRAMSMKRWLMSMPWTSIPRRASSRA